MSNILHSQSRTSVLAHVADNLRRYRGMRALSQEALASASSVSRRMIAGIEAGDANVSLATLDRLAEALGVRFSDLVQDPIGTGSERIEALAWAGATPESKGILLSSFTAAQEVEVWNWSLAPGESYVPVIHGPAWTETVCVTRGTLEITFSDGPRTIATGDFHAHRCDDTMRRYHNPGSVIVRFLRTIAH